MRYYQSDQRQGIEIGRTSCTHVKYEGKNTEFSSGKRNGRQHLVLLFIYGNGTTIIHNTKRTHIIQIAHHVQTKHSTQYSINNEGYYTQ
jgi:hypothetical protein